ncbi:MAG: hypothetical protein F7C32_00730 [Desulfurococcales archaeon]|nr:hypothetical protein [Desulfurococcales archaeon]
MKISINNIERISKLLKDLIRKTPTDDFTDPRYYPPKGADKSVLASYFIVLVAMDHRLSRPGRPYEARINGKLYHGADLLYRLGMRMLEEEPDFFDAQRLASMSKEDVERWLSPKEFNVPKPVDLELRMKLLRDLGEKICRLYDCEPYNIILRSRGRLRDTGSGFIERMKVFTAYQDPVEKKAFLLAKFLERRRVLDIVDPWNKEVPVDNHVTRLALRWRIVELDDALLEKIAGGVEFSFEEDVLLRYTVRIAFKLVSQKSGIDPFLLDDFLWSFGRKICKRELPQCKSRGKCPLSYVCESYTNPLFMVPEHHYYNTWFY